MSRRRKNTNNMNQDIYGLMVPEGRAIETVANFGATVVSGEDVIQSYAVAIDVTPTPELIQAVKHLAILCRARECAYEELSSFEYEEGKNSESYRKQLALINGMSTDIMPLLEKLRKNPESGILSLFVANESVKIKQSVATTIFDAIKLRCNDSIDSVIGVLETLHGRVLISTLEDEIAKADSPGKQFELIDYKNQLLASNFELENWYLHKGMFAEGQLLGVDEDPDPVAIAFIGISKEKYNEMKKDAQSIVCDEAVKKYVKACNEGGTITEYKETLSLGTLISLVDTPDNITLPVFVERAISATSEEKGQELKKIAQQASRFGYKPSQE